MFSAAHQSQVSLPGLNHEAPQTTRMQKLKHWQRMEPTLGRCLPSSRTSSDMMTCSRVAFRAPCRWLSRVRVGPIKRGLRSTARASRKNLRAHSVFFTISTPVSCSVAAQPTPVAGLVLPPPLTRVSRTS